MAARHPDYHHRCLSLHYLSELDKQQFSKLMLATIEGLPQDVKGSYWSCAEVRAANLVVCSDAREVWDALEKSAKRAQVGLRMQFINLRYLPASDDERGGQIRKLALRFLESFLDDATVRETHIDKDKYILCAARDYPKIEVRNFAAIQVLRIAGKGFPEKKERSVQQWAELREKAKEALKADSQGKGRP